MLRLGIAGGPGIGKTLLANALSARLGLPLVPEGVREWLSGGGHTSAEHLSRVDQEFLQERFIREKMIAEKAHPSFVSDRTVIDGFVIAERRLGHTFVSGTRRALYDACCTHAQRYYDVVLIPPAHFSLVHDPARTSDLSERRAQHAAILALAISWGMCWAGLEGTNVDGWVSQVESLAPRLPGALRAKA